MFHSKVQFCILWIHMNLIKFSGLIYNFYLCINVHTLSQSDFSSTKLQLHFWNFPYSSSQSPLANTKITISMYESGHPSIYFYLFHLVLFCPYSPQKQRKKRTKQHSIPLIFRLINSSSRNISLS